MTAREAAREWREGAVAAWRSAHVLFRAKQYEHALFFAHLALEKLLKAAVVSRTDREAPPTHDLVWLADRASLPLPETQRNDLAAMTDFSVSGRYPSRKDERRGKITQRYAREWLARAGVLYNSIESALP